jgi:hypothetical protein
MPYQLYELLSAAWATFSPWLLATASFFAPADNDHTGFQFVPPRKHFFALRFPVPLSAGDSYEHVDQPNVRA